MPKHRLKLVLAALLLLAATALAGAALAGIAALTAYFQHGADPAAALNIVPNRPPDLHVAMDWLPDAADLAQKPNPNERDALEAAYLQAWLQWNISYARGAPYGLGSFFAGPALAEAERAVQSVGTHGQRVAQTDTAHALRLRFFAPDGNLAAFRDEGALVAQIVRGPDGALVFSGESRADYDVVMVNDTGRWKVYAWTRTSGVVLGAPDPPTPQPGFVAASGTQLSIDGQPYTVAGINYYPQATPWERFWPQYDPALIDADLTRIRTLGLNTVRIFVPYEQFGGPLVEPAMLDRLADLLDRATAHDLRVIVTLFDFRSDYNPLLWADADRHMETILTRFAVHPAVLAWDLKNEPDRDYATSGQALVEAWLEHSARQARRYAPHHLISIGWSTPTAATALVDMVDVVSFHFYAPAEQLAPSYTTLRAATTRPILLTEFGLPTWNSFAFPNGHSEAEQAVYFADVLAALRTSDTAGTLAWTLYDFTQVPANVAGRWPWQTGPQQKLGVLRADGSAKPAAALLAPGAELGVPQLAPWARLLKPFWLTVTLAALLLLALLFVLWRRGGKTKKPSSTRSAA